MSKSSTLESLSKSYHEQWHSIDDKFMSCCRGYHKKSKLKGNQVRVKGMFSSHKGIHPRGKAAEGIMMMEAWKS